MKIMKPVNDAVVSEGLHAAALRGEIAALERLGQGDAAVELRQAHFTAIDS